MSALIVGPHGVSLAPVSTPGTGGRASLSIERVGDKDHPALLLGSATGTRVQIGSVRIAFAAEALPVRQALAISIDADSAELVIASGDGDGFLQRILPSDGIRAKFDLGATLSSDRGLVLRGGAGLETTIPLHQHLGPLSIDSITVGVEVLSDGLPIRIGANVAIELGPITAVALDIGLAAMLSFADGGGNLGPVGFDLGFKSPEGIGIEIDGGGFTGGGLIEHDPGAGRYTGIVDVAFRDLALTGIGILETRMSDASDGFSLFVSIGARFRAIQLGLGFTLNGVGGIIGIHRTARVDVIRAGLKDGSLGNILFPVDPIGNAAQITADLERVFPAEHGRFVLGPMMRIGWGTPTLITADVGLVIELPFPIRIAFVGVVRCFLPHAHAPILTIQSNFLGTVELERGRMAFDATLFDSHLLSFPLDGDISARLAMLPLPNYLLAVGGFHPGYTPPPMDLPPMRRLSINLLGGDNPRLRAEVYFARTSNSLQFGGSVELYAAVSKFNVYGFIGFDLLIQILPTHLAAAVKATLAVRIGDDPIMSVGVDFALEGPRPWHAKGSAHFKICWFLSFSVHFDKTWGEDGDDVLTEIDVLPLLLAALDAPDSWQTRLPANVHTVATLKGTDASIMEPAGTLIVSEKIVPLKLTVARFSSAKPRDAARFEITRVTSDNDELRTSDVTDEFAAAEFFEMTDAEKLSRPSFEQYPSGVAIDGTDTLIGADLVLRDVVYEQILVDRINPGRTAGKRAIGVAAFADLLRAGAVSRSAFAQERVANVPLAGITSLGERYSIVSTTDLGIASDASCASYAEAVEELRRITAMTPSLSGSLQIVTSSELAA